MLLVSSCVPVVAWLCSPVMRFQSRPTSWPLLTIESQWHTAKQRLANMNSLTASRCHIKAYQDVCQSLLGCVAAWCGSSRDPQIDPCSPESLHCSFPFRKRSMPFSRTNFLYWIKEKGKFESNHLVSNPEPLFSDVPLIPLHYQVDPPNLPKI